MDTFTEDVAEQPPPLPPPPPPPPPPKLGDLKAQLLPKEPPKQPSILATCVGVLLCFTGLKLYKKLGRPRPLFVYFWSFQTNSITIFTTDQCEKMSCPSSIQHWDSNPQPSLCEPPPITTRPGLPDV